MKVLMVVAVIFVESIYALSVPTGGHPHCMKRTCPHYNVVKKFGDQLELRCYKPSIWVSVSGKGKLYGQSHNLPIWKLLQFINGNNTRGTQVPIGTVKSKLFDEAQKKYSTEFYIPHHFWRHVPREVDPAVSVIYRRAFCVYVHGFSGWLHGYQMVTYYRSKAKELLLKHKPNNDYYQNFFFYVTYYSGFPYIPKYNEIWYVKPKSNGTTRV